jgi:hypothetical protein
VELIRVKSLWILFLLSPVHFVNNLIPSIPFLTSIQNIAHSLTILLEFQRTFGVFILPMKLSCPSYEFHLPFPNAQIQKSEIRPPLQNHYC